MVLAGRLPQSFHQAGLADPGFALDQHDLAAAAATAFPGPQQQPHLLLAPDEGCRAPGPARGKPALDIPRRQHTPGRHRLGEPLQLIAPQILEVEVVAEHRARGHADDDLVRLRQCLQTRRQVRCLADDRSLRCRSFADLITDDHWSRRDADPHRKLDPGRPGDRGIQLRHRIDDIETRPHRTLGLVLMGARIAEIDQDAVAHVFRDKAVVAPDRSTAAALKRRDDIAQIFGVHPGGECRRPHQVAKHHGQLAALGLRRRGDRGRRIGRGQNRRQDNPLGRKGGRLLGVPQGGQWLRQRRTLGSGQASLGRQYETLAVDIGRESLDPDQLATEFFETVVIEAEGELYPAIGDAALGDEAPEDLFQDPRKIHTFAPLAAAFVLVPGRSLPRA